MSEIIVDGFRFSKWSGDRQLLIVESDRLKECVEYCVRKRIQWLHISPYHGYLLKELNFLTDCRHVTSIHLQEGIVDLSGIYTLPNLRYLSAIFPHDLDFSQLVSLYDLSTDWNKMVNRSLFDLPSLKRLWLRGYKSVDGSLECMKGFSKLEALHIIKATIINLSGLELTGHLKTLELSHCSKLRDVAVFKNPRVLIEELEICCCKTVEDMLDARFLKKLKKLILSGCSPLKSLDFIREMPALEFLSFVNTNILDGDMTPCLKLKYAGFLKKRHYSHTPEEIARLIQLRG